MNQDGMAWLIGLAEQYEQVAKDIRHLHARLMVLTPPAETLTMSPSGGFGQLGISEAIREHLITKGPAKAKELTRNLDWSKVRTRSTNRAGLITSTLKSMEDTGAVHRIGDGRWDVSLVK